MALGAMRGWLLLSLFIGAAGRVIDDSAWYGRTIYFMIIDRFARTDKDGEPIDIAPQCGVFKGPPPHSGADIAQWCGGTINGIRLKLDYIEGMGFDAIWITPPVLAQTWPAQWGGWGYDGYYAMDWNKIDPHFGTEEDLQALSRELRRRGMLLMVDTVVNHAGFMWKEEQILKMAPPFNDPTGAAYHTLGIKPGQTFVEYLNDNPPQPVLPVMGSDGKPWYYCWAGNITCPAYNATNLLEGYSSWTDLNQENPKVAAYLKDWISTMVPKYDIDGIRLDTCQVVPQWFLREWQDAAGVPVFGEVMTQNMTWHRAFQRPSGPLVGLLNLPISLQWDQEITAYQREDECATCNDVWDVWNTQDTSFESFKAKLDFQKDTYSNVHLLGNFLDTHDTTRFLYKHHGDLDMLLNGLVWLFTYHGVPVFYYGTEDLKVSQIWEYRASMWYDDIRYRPYSPTSEVYQRTQQIISIRKQYGFGHGGDHVKSLANIIHADASSMAFTRGELLVAISNGKNNSSPYFCLNMTDLPGTIKAACKGRGMVTIFGTANPPHCEQYNTQLCVAMDHGTPAIFAAAPPPPVKDPLKDAFIAALVGLAVFTLTPVLFFTRWTMGRRKESALIEEDDDEDSEDF